MNIFDPGGGGSKPRGIWQSWAYNLQRLGQFGSNIWHNDRV